MSSWGWRDVPADDGRRILPSWARALAAAVPWLTLLMLGAMLWLVIRTHGLAGGTLFELPDATPADAARAELVALVVPTTRETLLFFDDARYQLSDDTSLASFVKDLSSRRERKKEGQTLLVLADRRVTGGDLMKLANLARRSGIERILFATKPSGGLE